MEISKSQFGIRMSDIFLCDKCKKREWQIENAEGEKMCWECREDDN